MNEVAVFFVKSSLSTVGEATKLAIEEELAHSVLYYSMHNTSQQPVIVDGHSN